MSKYGAVVEALIRDLTERSGFRDVWIICDQFIRREIKAEWEQILHDGLGKAPRVVRMTQTCNACPAQWEGQTGEGKYIYIRFRYGYLSVQLEGITIYGNECGDGLDGFMTSAELASQLLGVLDFSGCEWEEHDG